MIGNNVTPFLDELTANESAKIPKPYTKNTLVLDKI